MDDTDEMFDALMHAGVLFTTTHVPDIESPTAITVGFMFGAALGLRIGLEHPKTGRALLHKIEAASPREGEAMEVIVRNLADAIAGDQP